MISFQMIDDRIKIVLFNKIKLCLRVNLYHCLIGVFTFKFLRKRKLCMEKILENKKYDLIEVCKTLKAKEIYPKNILSVSETIDYIINNNVSLSRIGDGEELQDNILGRNCKFPELRMKLTEIMKNGSNTNCLVCINNFNADKENLPLFWRRHFLSFWTNIVPPDVLETLSFDKVGMYGDAYAFLFYFAGATKEQVNERKRYIEKIWENKKVLFVVNQNSVVLKDKECFKNVIQKEYIFAPEADAYSNYNEIYNKIRKNYSTEWLIYIEMGAMATVLAYELSKYGYQALDMGSFYSRIYHCIDLVYLDIEKT